MDLASFFQESRVLIVAGKGGVGKTTVAAALARAGAGAGLSVLLVELEGKAGLERAFGSEDQLHYDEITLRGSLRDDAGGSMDDDAHRVAGLSRDTDAGSGSVRARRITADEALLEYLADHGLQRISKRLIKSGVVDVVATAIPGLRDVLILGKVKQLERERAADLIVVDAPATGHTVTFLSSARGLIDAARGGPVRSQAVDVANMLSDASRCRVILVTLPEELPVSETAEAAFVLEDRARVHLGPIVVNAFDNAGGALTTSARSLADADGLALGDEQIEALEAARLFRRRRYQIHAEQVDRLAQELPLPQLPLPFLLAPRMGEGELDTLARALRTGIEALEPEPARS